jgi:prepilin-type N-terminal cleavage/methylation domain-containing protein
MHSRRGFTLLEVIVVVAIVAVLAALLFPVLSSVRRQAYVVICESNLRQIVTATRSYSQDHRGYLPWLKYPQWSPLPGVAYTHWFQLLSPYLGSRNDPQIGGPYDPYSGNTTYIATVLRACPEWSRTNVWPDGDSSKPGYGMHTRLLLGKNPTPGSVEARDTGIQTGPPDNGFGAIKFELLGNPSLRLIYGDSVDYHITLASTSTGWNFQPQTGAAPPKSMYLSGDPKRHYRMKACYGFADGHAELLDIERSLLLMTTR